MNRTHFLVAPVVVTLAIAPDRDAQCRAALSAYARHGAALQPSVEAMFARLHARGTLDGSRSCAWRPSGCWSAAD